MNPIGNPPRAHEYAERLAAFDAALASREIGPAVIALRDQALLLLPTDCAWLPRDNARRLLASMDQRTDDSLIGSVLPADEEADWLAVLRFTPGGFVREDEARHWRPDALLQGLRKSNEVANAQRARRGLPPLEITGWAQTPRFDPATHCLTWSAMSRYRDNGTQTQLVSYNARALGRQGHISLDLVTGSPQPASVEADAARLLAALRFAPGKTCADFDPASDRLAPHGLGALVTGRAARSKPGFLRRWFSGG